MKRFLALILSLGLLLSGCGAVETTVFQEETSFFYLARNAQALSERSAVGQESRAVGDMSLTELLDLYFAGPESEDLVSPFPAGTGALGAAETAEGLELTMSAEFFTLQGVDLSLACCCLSSTIRAYTGREKVILTDALGRVRLEADPDSYALLDGFDQDTQRTFTLYFSDKNHRYVCPETREAILSENESQETYVLRQLMAGPGSEELLPVIPEGTELLGVRTEDGVCTLDLSGEFYEGGEDPYAVYTSLYGVVNTLTGLEEVSAVRFLRQGQTVDFYGIFPLSQPLSRYAGAIGPLRSGSGEMDVDVYVLAQEDGAPFALPVRIQQSIQEPTAEAVARAAIGLEPPQGFYNPIPYGTELLSISLSGSVCYVDLSRRFIPTENTPENEEAAVWSLVAALTGLDAISSVVLTIEGDSGGLSFVDISEPLSGKMELPD